MKRKRLVIILVIVAIFVLAGLFFFRMAWVSMQGQEELSGSKASIPKKSGDLPPITKGKADWHCWRGPSLDGKSSVTGIKKDWSGGLQKLWEVNYLCQGKDSVTWSAPVVQGNRLVVPGRDENSDLIFCLNSENGELIWSASYEAKARSSHGPGARATPFIDSDRVYTFGRSGHLACWQLLDGKLLWKCNVEDEGGKEPTWGHSSSPFVYENKVIVQSGGQAFAIAYDKITGNVAWKSAEGPAGYAAPTLIKMKSEDKLLIFHGTGLSCLQPDDGKELWSTPWKTNYGVNATTPAVAGTTIFITSGYNVGCETLKAMDTGVDVLWRSKVIAAQHSDPIIIDGFIYGYSGQSNQNKGYFKCVELETGVEKWSTTHVGWGTAVYVDGHLICMDIKGNLFLVKPDPSAFRKVTEFRGAIQDVWDTAWTLPVVANGRIYLRYMQRLICYNLMP
jgi:outer membrane protein assembly factor BamB